MNILFASKYSLKTLFLMTVQHCFYHTDKHFPAVGYLGCFNIKFCFVILSNVAVNIR